MDGLGARYEVVRTVSEGRRATCFQALDRQHEKPVASKVCPVTSDTDRDEFLAEARVLFSITPHSRRCPSSAAISSSTTPTATSS